MSIPQKQFDTGLYEDTYAYDRIYQNALSDIRFYTKQAERASGSVLDLGCGTGRLTIPIAQKGIKITGLDISPSMLDTAQLKSEKEGIKITWVEDDFIHFNLKQKFSLIIMGGSTFQHLENTEQAELCLTRVKEHLKDNGLFAFDIFNPSMSILARNPEERFSLTTFLDPADRMVTVEGTNLYDRLTQTNHITWYYSRNDAKDYKVDVMKMRQYFPQEMRYILEKNDFEIVEALGDYDGHRLTSIDRRQIYVVKVKKQP